MHVTSLMVERFKRLHAINLTFSDRGQLIEICGDNGAGKSSAIDSLFSALGGAKASPDQPIHRGHRQATVSTRIGDLTVTRRWTPRGSSLTVTTADGQPVKSPQAILDSLYGQLAFDPLAFTQLPPGKQAETLRKLVGLDFTEWDAKRKAIFDDRTEVNRSIKSLRAQLSAAPLHPDAVAVDTAELMGKLRQANVTLRENDAARAQLKSMDSQLATLRGNVARLEKELAAARHSLGRFEMEHETAVMECQTLTDPDPSGIEQALKDAEIANRHVRENAERQAISENLRGTIDHADQLTRRLDGIDAAKAQRLGDAQFPVPGLSVADDVVTFGGLPLSQASTAEQIRTCLAISAALNPRLRVILVREGSFLDRENLALVAEWAAANDYQVFMERVQTTPQGTGVLIVEGEVGQTYGDVEAVPVDNYGDGTEAAEATEAAEGEQRDADAAELFG